MRKHLADALALRRELGGRSGIARSLINLGDVVNARGDPGPARTQYEESLVVLRPGRPSGPRRCDRVAGAGRPSSNRFRVGKPDAAARRHDWGEAPDVIGFLGRAQELTMLQEWVVEERCRLVAILGMGGMGKTTLAARLAQDIEPAFERVYWRSVRDAPSVSEWLAGAIGFLSDQKLVPPEREAERLTMLVQLVSERSSLLILDNFETLLEPGERQGGYRDGHAGYGQLLHALGEGRHQSCLVVTSREAPPELASLGVGHAVRALELGGLGPADGKALLADKQLSGDEAGWAELVARYGGNGLALKVAGETIHQVFGGDIAAFLEYAIATYGTVFGGIRRLLEAQVEQRLSGIEQELLRWLAIEQISALIGHESQPVSSKLKNE